MPSRNNRPSRVKQDGRQRRLAWDNPTLVPVSGIEQNCFLHLCEAVDSPRSLACWMLYKYREYRQLVELEIDPLLYDSVESFEGDYLCSSFFLKYRDFDLDIDREERAFQKWLAAEDLCRATNDKFRRMLRGDSPLFSSQALQALSLAQQKIHSILGDIDRQFIASHSRFGPGSDASTSGDKTSTYHKFGNRGSVTPWALDTFSDYFGSYWDDEKELEVPGSFVEDLVHESSLVLGNKLSFVPKNAKTDRAICTEPRWNVFIQLGIGDLIVKRLKRVGIDLKDQNPNREAASRAYDQGLATIDLSSASDTVSKNLVLELLPEDWSDLIFKTRSPRTFYKGKWYLLEKVSSMGNGYTFPLESLIFYAFAYAACRLTDSDIGEIRVFGDDIIVPAKAYATLVDVLSQVGFQVNPEKSFCEGPFFESCGSDYFRGKNVRPIFLKERVSNVERAIRLANQIVEFARRSNRYRSFNSRYLAAYQCCVERIPRSHRLFGPLELSTGVIHAPFDICKPVKACSTFERRGWEGYLVLAFVPTAVKQLGSNYRGHLYSKLFQDIATGNGFYTRNFVRWKRKIVYVPTYSDFLVS